MSSATPIPKGPNTVDLSEAPPAHRGVLGHLVQAQPMQSVDARHGHRTGFGPDMRVSATNPLDERVTRLGSGNIAQITKEFAAAEDYASQRDRFVIDSPPSRRVDRRGSAPELREDFEQAGVDSSSNEAQETQAESGKSEVESGELIGSGRGVLRSRSGTRQVTLFKAPSSMGQIPTSPFPGGIDSDDRMDQSTLVAGLGAKVGASGVKKSMDAEKETCFSRIQKFVSGFFKSVSGFFERRAEEARQKAEAAAEKEAREKPAKMRREFNEHFYNKLDGAVKNIGDAFKNLESETSNGPKTTKAFNTFIDSIYKEAQIVIDLMHFAEDQVRKGKDGPEIYQTALEVCQNALEKLKTSLGEQLTQSDDLKGVLALNVRNNLLSLLQTAKDAKGNMRFTQEQVLAISGDLAHLHADKGEFVFNLLLHIAEIKGGERYNACRRDLVAGHLNLRVQSESDLQSVSSQLNEMPFLNAILINRGFRLFVFNAIPKKLEDGASVEEIEIFTKEMLDKAIELQIFEGNQDKRIGDFLRTIQQENKEAFIEALFQEIVEGRKSDQFLSPTGLLDEVQLVISENEKSAVNQEVLLKVKNYEAQLKQREQEEIGRASKELLKQLEALQKENEEAALAEAQAQAELEAAQEAKEQSIVANFQQRLQDMDVRLTHLQQNLVEPIAQMQKELIEIGEQMQALKASKISYVKLDGTKVQGVYIKQARDYYNEARSNILEKRPKDSLAQLIRLKQLETEAEESLNKAAAEITRQKEDLDGRTIALLTQIEQSYSQINSSMREMVGAIQQIQLDIKASGISEERQKIVKKSRDEFAQKCKAMIDSLAALGIEIDLSSSPSSVPLP